MVNPCALKGISIFLGLVDALPNLDFAVVPTWGTTSSDRAELVARPNLHFLNPVDDIRDILRQTRVMLVPSLWAEGRGRIVVESMLGGVPVLASDRGGLREAAMGVTLLLPVNPIVKYQDRLDEKLIRIPEIPPQDMRPWHKALLRLTTDQEYYAATSVRSREAAKSYVESLSVESFDSLLHDLVCLQKPRSCGRLPLPSEV